MTYLSSAELPFLNADVSQVRRIPGHDRFSNIFGKLNQVQFGSGFHFLITVRGKTGSEV